jgi:hypothetical protein
VEFIVGCANQPQPNQVLAISARIYALISSAIQYDDLPTVNLSHSAGFDAFATAYVTCSPSLDAISHSSVFCLDPHRHVFLALRQRFGEDAVKAYFNHVYLMFSSKPLLLMKSQYE